MKIYHNDIEVLDVEVSDESMRHKAIMGENSLTLYFSLPEYVNIPIGSYADFKAERYFLVRPENLKRVSRRNIEYTLTMHSESYSVAKYKMRNLADKRLKFSITAKPDEILQLIVDNLNTRESGWSVGACIDAPALTLSFNHTYIADALRQLAENCNTEYEIVSKTISLKKVEYFKDSPVPLEYGKGKGFDSNCIRVNYEDKSPVEILFVEGGEKNIDPSKYGSKQLLLPKNQVYLYEGRAYMTDSEGLSIRRADKSLFSNQEDSLDLTHIYPSRVGEVSSVVVVDEDKNFYDIIDISIPEALDYSACMVEGESATIKFESGALAGREFSLEQSSIALTGYNHSEKRFKIVPAKQDGQMMPSSIFLPQTGDKYAIFGIQLPEAYICDNVSQSGASWEMFKEAVRFMYENEDPRFSFEGQLNEIYSKKNWLSIGGKLVLGGYIAFRDEEFQPDAVAVRITDIIEYVNSPYAPKLTLSNVTSGALVSSDLRKIEENEVVVEDRHREAISFTKRSFRDSVETISMLEGALGALLDFDGKINPVAIQTMALLVGDASLQFRFVNSKTTPQVVNQPFIYNKGTKVFSTPAGILQHMTLGIENISSSHSAEDYHYWDMAAYTSPVLDVSSEKFYLYAKCSKVNSGGVFILSKTAIPLDGTDYHFLVGTLNSEFDGDRSFAELYGFTEVLPSQVRTKKIISPDGNTYFDVENGVFSGRFDFRAGSSGLTNIPEFQSVIVDVNYLDGALSSLDNYIDGAFHDGVISEAEAKAIEKYINVINTAKEETLATYTKLYGNTYLSGAAKTALLNAKVTLFGAIDNLLSSVNTAILDGQTTPAEKADVDAKFATYRSALSSYASAAEDANKAIQDALKTLIDTYSYLKDAIAGSTEIVGGLILANMLLLKDQSNNVTAGMSGLTTNDLFLFAHSADALNMALNNKSTFLLRRDGTGNMGNFEITKTGVFFKERGADGRLGKTVVEFRSTPTPPLSDLVSSFTTSVSYAGGSATKMGGVQNGDFGYSSLITITAYDNFSLRVQGYLSILLMNDISTPISQTEVNIALVLYEYSGGQYINGTVMSSLGRYSIEPNLIDEDYNVDFTLTLPKGSYALRAEYHISARAGTNDYATAEASSVVLTASGAAGNKCLIFGSDGFVRVKDGNNYTYISDNTIAFKGLPSSAGGVGTGIVYSDNGTLKLS